MEYFEPASLLQLLNRLTELTRKDKLTWSQSANSEYDFSVVLGNFGFIVRSRDKDDFAPYVFDIYRVSPERKKLQSVETGEYAQGFHEELLELYELVKRRVMNIESVAREVFDELDKFERGGW